MNKDTSQYGESRYILQHFAGIGRFLDIGSFDGKTFSNTWPLAELGWTGVCVEPSPPAFCALMRNYGDNPRVRLVNAALCPDAKMQRTARFLCNTPDGYAADALSSLEQRHADKFAVAGHPFREIIIPTVDWSELLYPFCGNPFDFVNIDTEGTNAAVLRAMPIRPEMICVEYDPEADGVNVVHGILWDWGYDWKVVGGNVLGVRR